MAIGTEAGLFQGADIPTVVCGPGDTDQAYERLMAVLPIDDLSKKMFEENFAKPINKKDTMVDESAAGLVDEKGFGKFLLELEQNGHFGG